MMMFKDFFQVAYVTTDLTAAIDLFARDYGVGQWLRLPPSTIELATPRGPESAHIEYALAQIGGRQLELIQPNGGSSTLYSEGLPASGFGLRFHHLGCWLRGERKEWEDFRSTLDTARHPIAMEGGFGASAYLYTDQRDRLGHYLEYMWLDADASEMFMSAPQNLV
ncbi:MAG: hypothetical protein JWQ90_3089 [Hydrocarboniphaga sp.]|nr:hypothetical protein [Hydrocarboniphaga sp.]